MGAGFDSILALSGLWLAKPSSGGGGGGSGDTGDRYTLGHRAVLTLPSGVTKLHAGRASWLSQGRTIDVTGQSFAGADDRSKAFTRGLPLEEILLSGWVRGSLVGFGHRSTLTVNTVQIQPSSWSFSKSWPLRPVPGLPFSGSSEDQRGKWDWGVPVYSLRFDGESRNEGPLIQTEEFVVTLSASSIGSIAFDSGVHADRWRMVVPLQGGRTACSFAGRYEGNITYTPGSQPNDLSWLLIDPAADDDSPVRGSLSLGTGGGETIECSALMYSVGLYFSRAAGGHIRFDARLRVDSEVA